MGLARPSANPCGTALHAERELAFARTEQEMHTKHQDPPRRLGGFDVNVRRSQTSNPEPNVMKFSQITSKDEASANHDSKDQHTHHFFDPAFIALMGTIILNIICWWVFAWLITSAASFMH